MNLRNKKILIAGGAGFIGSHLCEKLLKEKGEITVFDNFSTGKSSNLESIKNKIKIIKGDIQNAKEIDKASKAQDIIIHEAFPYGAATRSVDKQFVGDGTIGTFNVLRSALKNNIKKVVYASTVAVYGIKKNSPQKEEIEKNPFLPYGATKYLGELYCSSFSNVYGLETVSLRYFNVFGPRYATFDHSAMILFLKRAIQNKDLIIYGDGRQIRDYTYVDDIVEGTILAAKKEKNHGTVYNLGKGRGLSIFDLAKKIVELTGSKSKIHFGKKSEYKILKRGLPYGVTKKINGNFVDERNYVANINKAKIELGYLPKISLEQGIIKTFQWMKEKI
ncbi:MAG: NAD-dependent epimerase/dehydratase family protein [Patescibacteria group bacterium]|nr:NAD-dependent epimerase/dehydratase family protein [Patescibacteria group bacterium]